MDGPATEVGEEMQALDLSAAETAASYNDTSSESTFDITAFLETHGAEITIGHDGRPISVTEAYYGCDGFARLVHSFGARAINMAAGPLSEKDETELEDEPDEELSDEDRTGEPPIAKQELKRPTEKTTGSVKESLPERTLIPNPKTIDRPAEKTERPAEVRGVVGQKAGEIYQVKAASQPEISAKPAADVRLLAEHPSSTPAEVGSFKVAPDLKPELKPVPTDRREVLAKAPEAGPIRFEQQALAAEIFIKPAEAFTPITETADVAEITEAFPGQIKASSPEKGRLEESALSEFEGAEARELSVDNKEIAIDLMDTEATVVEGESENGLVAAFEDEDIELAYGLPAPVEAVEPTIVELAKVIDELEPDEILIVSEIFNEIALQVKLLQELKMEEPEEQMTAHVIDQEVPSAVPEEPNQFAKDRVEVIEKEIEKLFTKLFDYLEVEYTPELIESFVRLTIQQGMPNSTNLDEREAELSPSRDKGTHEIIRQLLAVTNGMQTELGRAYQIGKSVILLYSRQLTAAR